MVVCHCWLYGLIFSMNIQFFFWNSFFDETVLVTYMYEPAAPLNIGPLVVGGSRIDTTDNWGQIGGYCCAEENIWKRWRGQKFTTIRSKKETRSYLRESTTTEGLQNLFLALLNIKWFYSYTANDIVSRIYKIEQGHQFTTRASVTVFLLYIHIRQLFQSRASRRFFVYNIRLSIVQHSHIYF